MPEVSVWAPTAGRVRLQITLDDVVSTHDLSRAEAGWWRSDVARAVSGADYGFLLDDDETLLPDPRSRRQPSGVHGPSRFYADNFEWSDGSWQGAALPGAVIYELHVGTFTPAGTFDSAIDRLDYLVDLGISHVELLPVNAFNGTWNWGYDGVLWYAVHEAYGGPDGLKRLVDACHQRGLAVTLDVVYNHLGPSGNYLGRFGPYQSAGRGSWGDLINLDGDASAPVRAYIIANALMWLDEFHIDALRLDAVHALIDTSTPHLLSELSAAVDALEQRLGRRLTLIAESDLNDPVMITDRAAGGYGLDAQWDDDVHHALHALLSGERQGYYHDFGSLACFAKVFSQAFLHDGTYSTFRGRAHGKPADTARTPGYRFVACLQNHDQVGNRAAGDRLPEIASTGLLEVGAVLLLTAPFTPMLWMGEEWAAGTRWPFFTSHPEPELAEATGKGRMAEFAEHGWDVTQMIDPQDEEAFRSAHLDWRELEQPAHAKMHAFYRDLMRLRRSQPELSDPQLDRVRVDFDEQARWVVVHRGRFRVLANLAGHPQPVPLAVGEVIFATQPDVRVGEDQVWLAAETAAIVRVAG